MKETTIYLIRDSESLFIDYNNNDNEENNDKKILSIKGEEIAKKVSLNEELNNLDMIYSSTQVRAVSSAKYIAKNNNLNITCNKKLNDKKIGLIGNLDIQDYEKMQYKDFDYKLYGGESVNDINKRMTTILKEILVNNPGKRIGIMTHSSGIISLLINWCNAGYNFDGDLILDYKGNNIYDGIIEPMQIYKLQFQELKLINIKKI